MPLTLGQLNDIQADTLADDVEIDVSWMGLWSEAQAREYFESGGRIVPPTPEGDATASAAAKERGTAHLKVGEYDLAAASYREALALGGASDLAALHSNLSLALLRAGKTADAAAAAEAAIAAKPEWHKAHYRLGDARFDARDYAGAAAAYSVAVSLSNGDTEAAAAVGLATEATKGGLWLRQLLPGRDIALTPTGQLEATYFGAAKQMQNLIYLVGDLATRECGSSPEPVADPQPDPDHACPGP